MEKLFAEKEILITVDTETTGLSFADYPFLVTAVIETPTWKESFLFDLRKEDIPSWFLGLYSQNTVQFMNATLDARMIYKKYGVYPRSFIDLKSRARLRRNDYLEYSLASIAKRNGLEKSGVVDTYIGQNKLYEERPSGRVPQYYRVPNDILYPYAIQDAEVTHKLIKLESVYDDRSLPVVANEDKLVEVCLYMERAGVKLDKEYTQSAIMYEKKKIMEAKTAFLNYTKEVYTNKREQLVRVLQNDGETIGKTDKGNYCLNEEALESFTSPVAKIIQEIRYREKKVSTFYQAYLNLVTPDELIHPSMDASGTVTGRFSYTKPNMQQCSKEEDSVEPFVVRGCFVPRRTGNILVSIDYSQMEYRMLLAYANESKLIKEVMAGADIHQATADLLGTSRKAAKTINFGLLYGQGNDLLAQSLGVSVNEARRIKEGYFLKLPRVERFIHEVIKKGKTVGHVYTWLGRKLHVNSPDFAYKLVNYLIQGGGADVCKVAMNRIHPLIKDFSEYPMILQIHDALVFDLRPEDLGIIEPIVEIMETAFPTTNGMQLKVDVSYSTESLAERTMKKWDKSLVSS